MAWIQKKPFSEWILIFAKLYFLPIGRIGRIDYLIAFITVFIIGYFGVLMPGLQFGIAKVGANNFTYTLPPGKEYISQLVSINSIICAWILLCSSAKRLKDLDSKVWYVIFVIIPAVNLFVLLGLLLSEGSPRMNKYGPVKKPLSL